MFVCVFFLFLLLRKHFQAFNVFCSVPNFYHFTGKLTKISSEDIPTKKKQFICASSHQLGQNLQLTGFFPLYFLVNIWRMPTFCFKTLSTVGQTKGWTDDNAGESQETGPEAHEKINALPKLKWHILSAARFLFYPVTQCYWSNTSIISDFCSRALTLHAQANCCPAQFFVCFTSHSDLTVPFVRRKFSTHILSLSLLLHVWNMRHV